MALPCLAWPVTVYVSGPDRPLKPPESNPRGDKIIEAAAGFEVSALIRVIRVLRVLSEMSEI